MIAVTSTERTRLIDAIVASAQGRDWPEWAVYALDYSVQAWPTEARTHRVYLPCLMALRAELRRLREFGRYEGNHYQLVSLSKWDWGPELIHVF